MSTATLPAIAEPSHTLTPETLERLVVGGDLSVLSTKQKLEYYNARCNAAGLDPCTRPFEYLFIKKQSKLILYATKSATDQLTSNRHLRIEILDRRALVDIGIYEVTCRVTPPDGQFVDDMGVVPIAGLVGDDLCNAILKCCTKAKRRTILSACGLGMLDESELETIADARPAPAPLPAGVADSTGEEIDQYQAWVDAKVGDWNSRWLDKWTNKDTGEIPDEVKDICTSHQLTGHLAKWATAEGHLPAGADPNDRNFRTRLKIMAKVWRDHGPLVNREAVSYARKLAEHFEDEWNKTRDTAAPHGNVGGPAAKGDAFEDDRAAWDAMDGK